MIKSYNKKIDLNDYDEEALIKRLDNELEEREELACWNNVCPCNVIY